METFHKKINCPHCGHFAHFSFDKSNGDQNYYEDCPNCCNPVHFSLHVDELHHKVEVTVDSDDEQIY